MIGSLRGVFTGVNRTSEAILDVQGVGYRVMVPPRTAATLAALGEEIILHTHLRVREDALTLYGFATPAERDCFEAMLGAHGVGPAMALAVLSMHAPLDLHRILAEGDLEALVAVPGIGRKTAARLLLDLKSRLDVPEMVTAGAGTRGGAARGDVRSALSNLGYEAKEISDVLRELPAEGTAEDLLRTALALMKDRRR